MNSLIKTKKMIRYVPTEKPKITKAKKIAPKKAMTTKKVNSDTTRQYIEKRNKQLYGK